jgi:hypothetical protein
MFRLTASSLSSLFAVLVTASLSAGCGGGKEPPKTPDKTDAKTDTDAKTEGDAKPAGDGKDAKPEGEKKDECTGFEIGNLDELLSKSACEEPGVKPDGLPPVDLKGKLEVTVTSSPTKIAPGGKADLIVSFTNKSKEPLTLHFRIDPVARFEVEAYDAKKNARVDMPAGKPPPPPKGVTAPPANEAKSARVTLAPNGSARAKVAWEAVKTKWAPEKVKGSAPERGYPRTPAGPLGKGKVVVKVVTPLVGVNEGGEKEFTIPKVELEIGG